MNHNRGRGQSRNYIVPHKHFSCNSLPLKNDFNTLLSEKNDELQPLDFIEKMKLYLLSFRESINIPYSFLLLQMSTFTHSYHDIIMPF